MPTLLITGANRGLGLEITRQYLADDWHVIATCRNPQQADELKTLASTFNQTLTIKTLDISNHQDIQRLSESMKKMPIDLLINNAAIYAGNAHQFGQTDTQVWEEAARVNIIGPMKMMEFFVENVAMSQQKTMVAISSKMGSINDNSSGGCYAYRATKAALNAVMVSAAHDLKPRSIKVLILHPGWARTDMGGPNGEISATESASMLKTNITNSTMDDTGTFIDIDGSIIPW